MKLLQKVRHHVFFETTFIRCLWWILVGQPSWLWIMNL